MNRRRGEQGAVALLVAVLSMSLFGVAALVVDLSQARVLRRSAQTASDSAALAAMNSVYRYENGQIVADIEAAGLQAKHYVETSYYGVDDADWAGCLDSNALAFQPLSGIPCISFDDDDAPTEARVVVPAQSVDFNFASVFGATGVSVSAEAQAEVTVTPGAECGLCLVGSGPHDLQNGSVSISGGNIAINGDVNVQNNGLAATDGEILVEGDADGTQYEPAPTEHQPAINDPLARYDLPPAYPTHTVKTDPCGTGSTHGPGIYGDYGFPNATCHLEPGLYVITGRWDFTGGAALDATSGVTLYFTCGAPAAVEDCEAPGELGGWLDAAGNGNISITAPGVGSPTAGFAIIYDRLNESQLNLSGNGAGEISGTIYALSAKLRYDGNACSANKSLIIVDSLELNGNNACLESDYDQAVNAPILPDDLRLSE